MIDKCILITGGFDPIHSGHIAYINDGKKICEYLVVGINSDEWLVRKKGTNFMIGLKGNLLLVNLN